MLQAGSVITGILAGNPGMAAIQQEGRIGGMVTGWAMRAPRAAIGAADGRGSAVRSSVSPSGASAPGRPSRAVTPPDGGSSTRPAPPPKRKRGDS